MRWGGSGAERGQVRGCRSSQNPFLRLVFCLVVPPCGMVFVDGGRWMRCTRRCPSGGGGSVRLAMRGVPRCERPAEQGAQAEPLSQSSWRIPGWVHVQDPALIDWHVRWWSRGSYVERDVGVQHKKINGRAHAGHSTVPTPNGGRCVRPPDGMGNSSTPAVPLVRPSLDLAACVSHRRASLLARAEAKELAPRLPRQEAAARATAAEEAALLDEARALARRAPALPHLCHNMMSVEGEEEREETLRCKQRAQV